MKKPIFWILVFSIVIALAGIILFYSGPTKPAVFGLPNWLIYFFGVEILFCIVYYIFTRVYWTTDD